MAARQDQSLCQESRVRESLPHGAFCAHMSVYTVDDLESHFFTSALYMFVYIHVSVDCVGF